MKSPIILSTLILATLIIVAQSQTPPQAFSYQALVRDGAGAAVRNQVVGVRVRLHLDSANTGSAYSETFTPTTNGYGNINLSIGRGSVVSGTFASVDWTHSVFVEIGVDVNGGSTYADLGTTQLLSVPYAMYSGRSGVTSSANVSEIHDADNNTNVSTERNANENIIRFDLNSREKMRLRGNALEFPNTGLSVYIGDSAGFMDTSETTLWNVFLGNGAGRSNIVGSRNVFTGFSSGYFNTTGFRNTFYGSTAGYSNSSGNSNTFSGYSAGFSNTTGNYNTFIGGSSGYTNNTGFSNTFAGYQAGELNTSGYANAFTGSQAGYNTTTGYNNTFAGNRAGFWNSTGYGNVSIGYYAGPAVDDTNKLYINNTSGAPLIWGDFAADSVRINGGMSVARSITATAFVNASDRRLKENIQPVSNALTSIGMLNGVYYNYKSNAPDGNPYPKGRQIGVIAQDVEQVYPELVATQPGGYKAVDYPKLTAVLIEAVKEQQRTIETLKSGNAAMAARMEKVEAALRLSQSQKHGPELAKTGN